jgi:hypothetical protein
MFNHLLTADSQLIESLSALPFNSLLIVIALAVLLAPVVYRYRLLMRRQLRRLVWIAVGFALGWASAVYLV